MCSARNTYVLLLIPLGFLNNNILAFRCAQIYAIQKHLKNLKAGECLMLNGDLVYGKKWLAIDACSNYEIMEHMGSEIYLVKLDKCHTEEDVYDLLVR